MTYIAFDIEDRWYASICLNESDLQLCLSNIFGKRPFPTVHEYEVGGRAWDVTDEMREKYGPKPEPDEYEDDETSERRYRAGQSRKFTFGTRSL